MLNCCRSEEMLALLREQAHDMMPSEIACAWHVVAQRRLLGVSARGKDASQKALLDEILSLTNQHGEKMGPLDTSTVVWAMASVRVDSEETFTLLCKQIEREIVSFRPGELCICLWAVSRATWLPCHIRESPFKRLAGLVEEGMKLDLFDTHDLSVLVWSMGKSQMGLPALLLAVTDACTKHATEFSPSDASRLLHGFSMLRYNPVSVISGLTETCAKNIDAFGPEDLSLLLLSLGRLCVEPSNKFMRLASKRAAQLAPLVKRSSHRRSSSVRDDPRDDQDAPHSVLHPRHMTHILWTFARLEYSVSSDTGIAAQCFKHATVYPSLYSAEDLRILLWSSNRLNLEVPTAALAAMIKRLRSMVSIEKSSQLIHTFRDLSCLQARSKKLVERDCDELGITDYGMQIAHCLAPVAHALSSSDTATLIVALGTVEAGVLSPTVEKAWQTACKSGVPSLPVRYLSKLAWALVRLKWVDGDLHATLASTVREKCGLMSREGLAQAAWSFAALRRPYPGIAKALETACRPQLKLFDPQDLVRLAWSFARFEHFGVSSHRGVSFLKRILQSMHSRNAFRDLDPLNAAAVLWSISQCREHPGPSVMDDALSRVAANVEKFDRSHLMYALAAHKKHPSRNHHAVEEIGKVVYMQHVFNE